MLTNTQIKQAVKEVKAQAKIEGSEVTKELLHLVVGNKEFKVIVSNTRVIFTGGEWGEVELVDDEIEFQEWYDLYEIAEYYEDIDELSIEYIMSELEYIGYVKQEQTTKEEMNVVNKLNEVVYRENWELDDYSEEYARDSYMINNDDADGREEFDYINVEDYELVKEIGEAVSELTDGVQDFLYNNFYSSACDGYTYETLLSYIDRRVEDSDAEEIHKIYKELLADGTQDDVRWLDIYGDLETFEDGIAAAVALKMPDGYTQDFTDYELGIDGVELTSEDNVITLDIAYLGTYTNDIVLHDVVCYATEVVDQARRDLVEIIGKYL